MKLAPHKRGQLWIREEGYRGLGKGLDQEGLPREDGIELGLGSEEDFSERDVAGDRRGDRVKRFARLREQLRQKQGCEIASSIWG